MRAGADDDEATVSHLTSVNKPLIDDDFVKVWDQYYIVLIL